MIGYKFNPMRGCTITLKVNTMKKVSAEKQKQVSGAGNNWQCSSAACGCGGPVHDPD